MTLYNEHYGKEDNTLISEYLIKTETIFCIFAQLSIDFVLTTSDVISRQCYNNDLHKLIFILMTGIPISCFDLSQYHPSN